VAVQDPAGWRGVAFTLKAKCGMFAALSGQLRQNCPILAAFAGKGL
jgi:hypothetical protein